MSRTVGGDTTSTGTTSGDVGAYKGKAKRDSRVFRGGLDADLAALAAQHVLDGNEIDLSKIASLFSIIASTLGGRAFVAAIEADLAFDKTPEALGGSGTQEFHEQWNAPGKTHKVTPRRDFYNAGRGAQSAALPAIDPSKIDPKNVEALFDKLAEQLKLREGVKNTVYKDSEGHLTVGIGHLVTAKDGLRYGQTISNEQVMAFFKKDAAAAFNAGIQQAAEAGITNPRFVVALANVNFQLGLGWRDKFHDTWADIKAGKYDEAIGQLERSLWNRQTPVRVDDFQTALKDIRDNGAQLTTVASADTGTRTPDDPNQSPTSNIG